MVDFNSPTVLEHDFLAVARLWTIVDGLYIWEFITALDFEWSFIRGSRNHNWTIWIYATTRVATLFVVILNLLSIWITTQWQYNCTAALIGQLFVGYLAVASSSLLIALRVIAIWNRKRMVLMLSSGAWVTSVIFSIQSIARVNNLPDYAMIEVLEFGLIPYRSVQSGHLRRASARRLTCMF